MLVLDDEEEQALMPGNYHRPWTEEGVEATEVATEEGFPALRIRGRWHSPRSRIPIDAARPGALRYHRLLE